MAHIVLFKPKPELSALERQRFIEAFRHALVSIPAIKRARVGRRLQLGRQYDAHNAQQFPYAVILEFEDQAALIDYLDHDAHRALGEHFYAAAESALAFDFDLLEADQARELLA